MKTCKVLMGTIFLLFLSACSFKSISKSYDLAILDDQRVVTFLEKEDQLEKLEEGKALSHPYQLWKEDGMRIGDSFYNRTTDDYQIKTFLVKLNTKTFDSKEIPADGNGSYTRATDGEFIYSTAVFNDRTEFYKYDKDLNLIQKQELKEEGKMNLTNDLLVVGDDLFVLIGSIDMNLGSNENQLWRLSKDFSLKEKIDLDYTAGGYMRMVYANGIFYITEAKEGVAADGEPNGGKHIVAFNLKNREKTLIETSYTYPQFIHYDKKRNRLLVLHDPNYVPYVTWTFIDLTTGKQSQLRFEEQDGNAVFPFYAEQDGFYYYLFDDQLVKYNPDTQEKVPYDLAKYGIKKAHTLIFYKKES